MWIEGTSNDVSSYMVWGMINPEEIEFVYINTREYNSFDQSTGNVVTCISYDVTIRTKTGNIYIVETFDNEQEAKKKAKEIAEQLEEYFKTKCGEIVKQLEEKLKKCKNAYNALLQMI